MAIKKSTNNLGTKGNKQERLYRFTSSQKCVTFQKFTVIFIIDWSDKASVFWGWNKKDNCAKTKSENLNLLTKTHDFYKQLKKGYFKLWPGIKTSLKLEEEEIKAESRITHWLPMQDRMKIITNEESWEECVMLDWPQNFGEKQVKRTTLFYDDI